jgi:putative membrane protein
MKLLLFITSTIYVIYIIFIIIGIPPIYSFGFFIPLIFYNLLTKFNENRALLLSSLSSLSVIMFTPFKFTYLLYNLFIIFILYLYIYFVNRKGKKTIGFPSLKIARPFLTEIVHKDNNPLEKFLDTLGYRTNIQIGIFKIGDFHFIIPKLHFGIFGRIGSSRFIYDLEDKISNSIVFHGPGSHELDLVSRRESLKIVNELSNLINRYNKIKLDFKGIKIWNCNNFKGVTLLFSNSSLTFLEREDGGIDDLPLSLWDFILAYNAYIIDTHSLVKERDFTKEEISSLKSKIREIISDKSNANFPLYFGISELKMERNYEGYCDKRVKIMVLSDGIVKLGIVYVYANNALKELYYEVKKILSRYVDYGILVTPDDHSCTGVTIGKLYEPASLNHEILKLVENGIINALNNMRRVEAYYQIFTIKGVKVLGSIVSIFVHGLEVVGRYVIRTFWIPFVLPIIVLITLLLLGIPL